MFGKYVRAMASATSSVESIGFAMCAECNVLYAAVLTCMLGRDGGGTIDKETREEHEDDGDNDELLTDLRIPYNTTR